MQDKIQTLFREIFNAPELEIRREMNANDVDGWDSITHAEMIAAVEKLFGVKFKLREITKWENVGDMMDTLEKKGVS
ncbi:MAG: acyl carrier protein [Bacteroidota bacterium]